MFGLVTIAAVHYLSGSSPLMRPSAEVEVEKVEEERAQGGGRGEGEGRGAALCTSLPHTGCYRFTSKCRRCNEAAQGDWNN